jgi:hypothetical protein
MKERAIFEEDFFQQWAVSEKPQKSVSEPRRGLLAAREFEDEVCEMRDMEQGGMMANDGQRPDGKEGSNRLILRRTWERVDDQSS